MTDPQQSERSIFLEAIDRSAEERTAFLDAACGNNQQLRAEVEALLRAHEQSGDLLDAPDRNAPTIDQPITESAGTQIGPYKLLQQIGEGGMGVVYMAEQTKPVERRVALKIIKPGMDSRQVIARFEAERQALAMMDHPNIAKVLDAGTTDTGRPYFVMELVKGLPITQYCDEQQLTPRERLELFLPICQAVQHAHQRGVIHRDLKPSNILVARYDDKAVPKIIDFGVAKAVSQRLTEKTMFTQYGQIVGTIEYMSPEQAQFNHLDVDTRSDIYSLGVLLYELLTGNTPFDKQRLRSAAFDELLRIIREEEPPRPSVKLSTCETLPSIAASRHIEPHKLSTLVRGELDWIVMKALEKDRSRRYETASGFAADVQHYLNDEAVVACPPSAAYKFRKFARRNKVAIGTTGLVAASLVAGIAGTTWQAIRATHERDRAVAAEGLAADEARRARDTEQGAVDEAERANDEAARADAAADRAWEQKQQAEANFELARQAVDEYFTLVSESTLLNEPGLQSLRRDLLQAAAGFHQDFASRRKDDPDTWADLAAAHLRLVGVYSMFGDAEKMLSEFHQGVTMAKRILEQQPDDTAVHRKLAGFWKVRGDDGVMWRWIMSHPRKAPDHLRVYEEAIEVWNEFARRSPGEDGFHADISVFWDVIGVFYWSMGERKAWIGAKRKVVEIREQLVREHPEIVEHRSQLAHSYIGLCNPLQFTDPQESVELIRRAIAIREELVAEFPDVPGHQYWLAEHLHRLGQNVGPRAVLTLEEREKCLREAIRLLAELDAEFPYEPLYRTRIIGSYRGLAELLLGNGRTEAAVDVLSTLMELDPDDPLAYLNLGRALAGQNKLEEAIAAYRRAIKLDPKSTMAHRQLGDLLRRKGDTSGAIDAYSTCIELSQDGSGPHNNFGLALLDAGRTAEAAVAFKSAAAYFDRLAEADPSNKTHRRNLQVSLINLAKSHLALGNQQAHQEACQSLVALFPPVAERKMAHWGHLGQTLYRAGQYREARAALEQAIKLRGDNGPSLGPRWWYLAMTLCRLGETDRARSIHEQLVQIMNETPPARSKELYDRLRAEAAELLTVNGAPKKETTP